MARAPKTPPTEAAPAEADDAAPVRIFQKKALIEKVAEETGIKKKTVKPVVEAVLAEIGTALSRGDALNLVPLGKVSVNRTKEGPNADVLILKLRRAKGRAEGSTEDSGPDDAED